MIDVKRISNWEKEYLSMNKNLTKREKEILEGSELKPNEGMVFGRMYADWKKQNPDKDEMDFYKEKGIAIKRIELDKGGVVSLSDYLKQKQKPKIKKIDLAQGDFEKTVASLTDSDKDLIKALLRKSGVLVGD
jgi:hypothetical protein